MSGMRIVFATFGSLGDLHPYVAIARELVRRGHRPVVATFDAFREAVEASGVAGSAGAVAFFSTDGTGASAVFFSSG